MGSTLPFAQPAPGEGDPEAGFEGDSALPGRLDRYPAELGSHIPDLLCQAVRLVSDLTLPRAASKAFLVVANLMAAGGLIAFSGSRRAIPSGVWLSASTRPFEPRLSDPRAGIYRPYDPERGGLQPPS